MTASCKEKVSIIVPVFNMAGSLERCVSSLTAQDYENIEIILVDDGSTDNTLSVCQRLSEADARITVFHTENRGAGPARNYGISVATGRYALFPDADDYLEPKAISTMTDAMKDGVDLVICGYKSIIPPKNIVHIKNSPTELRRAIF